MKCSAIALSALLALGLAPAAVAQPVDIARRHAHNLHARAPVPDDVVMVTVQAIVTAQAYQNDDGVVVVTQIVDADGNPIDTATSTSSTAEPTTTSTYFSTTTSNTYVPSPTSSVSVKAAVLAVESSTSSASPTSTSVYVAPTSTVVSVSSSSTSSSSSSSTTLKTSTTSSSSAAASSTSSSGSFSSAALGITYSPYTSSGACKTADEVASDLAELTSYSVIRLYGVDCSQVENVYPALADGQKLFLGIFDVTALDSAISTIAAAVSDWDTIHTVAIGNELVNGGSYTADEVVTYLNAGRTALRAVGYTGPVVTVDTHVAILANPTLCTNSDYPAFNAHSFWDGTTLPEDAGTWLELQVSRVNDACGSSDAICTESGWPTQGDDFGVAVPSTANQKTAISAIESSVGAKVIEFTAFNDLWKSPGDYNVEQYWGILD
ncbi:glycoside hydrolase superfamily [Myxozyma melibiosi]|uniref:Glycoside hydrolase superfamily n=1 Tax=Myxozyma melibiosi TaxID=54550 RepID=A0ABR1F9G3_9ASCO